MDSYRDLAIALAQLKAVQTERDIYLHNFEQVVTYLNAHKDLDDSPLDAVTKWYNEYKEKDRIAEMCDNKERVVSEAQYAVRMVQIIEGETVRCPVGGTVVDHSKRSWENRLNSHIRKN